ncbi:MAG: alpha/beta hydrolase, partial [Gammaproteobacteria bacterium]|nr:alpha/beta hydrolase [Gammaproteobacteria bacterium]
RYAKKLSEAGVQCQLHQFDQMIHAFINLDDLVPEQCQQLYLMIGQAVKS